MNKRLTNLERAEFTIPQELKDILIGLTLGDLNIQKQTVDSTNVRLQFEQGLLHETYLLHLYHLFKDYCTKGPNNSLHKPNFRTGKTYSRVTFYTYSLPCFNELYDLFYVNNKKIIPHNLFDLLT